MSKQSKRRWINVAAGIVLAVATGIGHAADSYGPVPVRLKCDGKDPVGQSFCYQLQEAIIASHQFKLVYQGPSWVIHAVTVDPMNTGAMTAVAVVITLDRGRTNEFELYQMSSISTVGSYNLNQVVANVLSELSEQVNEFRTAVSKP